MSKLEKTLSRLEKLAAGNPPRFSRPTGTVSFEELQEKWKSEGVAAEVNDFVKQGFKAIKLYEELMRPMHGHPELKEPYSQMKHIYECLIQAKNGTEKAIEEWRRFQSIL